jgi:carbonic anhydrase
MAEVEEHSYFSEEARDHAAPWSYEGSTGPENWGELALEYHMAKDGREQSPIDIDTAAVQPSVQPTLHFEYGEERSVFTNNGHTIQHDAERESYLEIQGKRYRLEQFHGHTPSEHSVDGRYAPLEIHFVHRAADGEVAVVAVLVQEGSSRKIRLFPGVESPDQTGERETMNAATCLMDYLPTDHSYYEYQGSFTTPPCTEGVRWFVLKQWAEASRQLLSELHEILKNNNRPVQPLNDRIVKG